jgi:precorrin-6x reductase
MILVFGGTTEGRKAAEVLEESGSTFYYSTKTGEQELTLKHGVRTDGAMDGMAMRAFCGEHGIRLIVDAAHPFAAQLHKTIGEVARALDIPERCQTIILTTMLVVGEAIDNRQGLSELYNKHFTHLFRQGES